MSDLHKMFDEYLEHSYRYYKLDSPVVSDDYFDRLCLELKERWDEIEHPHKNLTDKHFLEQGTGYQLYWTFPAYITDRVDNE